MIWNTHTYYSLRYGTMSVQELVKQAQMLGLSSLGITDINCSTGIFEFVKCCEQHGIKPLALGKFGVLSPSKNGSNTKPWLPGCALNARFAKSSKETFKVAAPAFITLAAFNVQASGKKFPAPG